MTDWQHHHQRIVLSIDEGNDEWNSNRDLARLIIYNTLLTEALMATLDRITADVHANTSAVGSVTTLLSSIAQQLRDAATDPTAVNALADEIESSNALLAAAVAANTPSATEPPVVTPPDPGPTQVPPVDTGAGDGSVATAPDVPPDAVPVVDPVTGTVVPGTEGGAPPSNP